jgi:hypothetical protein
MGKTGRELFDDYIKLDWPQEVKAAGVKKRDGSAYVPVKRNVSLLREDVNALDEAVRLWSDEDAEGISPGYAAIVEQAGVEFTWEYALIAPGRPWANDVPPRIRARIEHYLARDHEAVRQRDGERRQRIEAIREEIRSGRRPRMRLPGE